jgi:hypothetical protein
MISSCISCSLYPWSKFTPWQGLEGRYVEAPADVRRRPVKVRVERVRRGRRTPEVEYVEAKTPRNRWSSKPEDEHSLDHTGQERDRKGSRPLRLPWRINSRQE